MIYTDCGRRFEETCSSLVYFQRIIRKLMGKMNLADVL